MRPHHCAVIFDVDGPLLELTPLESATFFLPFAEHYDLTGLSEDWDSYRIRNDVEIYREILTDRLGVSDADEATRRLSQQYITHLERMFNSGTAAVAPISGALSLLETLSDIEGLALGTATANFEAAARMRLERVMMWNFVRDYHSGAEGGGAKRDVLARVIARLELPGDRIVFLGDNLNDLDAADANGVHFIGFHVDADRRERLVTAGAKTVTGDHAESLCLIREFLSLA